MHPSSVVNMQHAKQHAAYVYDLDHPRVIDVGGLYDVPHKSYQRLWEDHPGIEWTVADIVDHPSVDVVMPGPYTLPFADDYFDLVVSGQMLEHCRNPFRSVAEMRRVVRPGCMIIIVAPSEGPRHDRVDCWRFLEDAFVSIAEETGLEIIADWIDRSAPDQRSRQWADHVFVGRKPVSAGAA